MDLTVLNLAIPRISAELRPSSVQLLWIFDIYGFLVAGLLITMGTLGDRIGRRKLLLGGAAGFALASVLAALSTSAEMLIASRAIMGIAGATIAPSTLSLIFTMFLDPKQRSTAIGFWIAAYSAGSAVGPVVGGVLLEFFWWGSVFLIGVPVMGLLLDPRPAHAARVQGPERSPPGPSQRRDVAARDPRRGLWTEGDRPGRDRDSCRSCPSSAGVVLGIAFVRRQLRLESPIIDVRLFRIRAFSASLGTYLLAIFVVVGYFLLIGQYLQLVLGLSPLTAALWSLPSAIGFMVGSITAPRIIHRFRPSVIMGTGMAVAALGAVLLLGVSADGGGSLLLIVGGLAGDVARPGTRDHAGDGADRRQRATGAGRRRHRHVRDERRARRRAGDRDPRQHRYGRVPVRGRRFPPRRDHVPRSRRRLVTRSAGRSLSRRRCQPISLPRSSRAAQTAFVDSIHFVAVVSAIGAVATAIAAASALRTVPARSEPAPSEEAIPEAIG